MRKLKFYKETDQWFGDRWYVDLPEWTGSKADLEMVAGADTMLYVMAEGEKEVCLHISETHFDGANEIIFKRLADDIGSGAYYILRKYMGIELNQEMWLCDVMLTVFGRFPEQIFIKNVGN